MSIFSEALGAGNGGLHNQDGADGMIMHLTNAANTPVEAVEIEHPFLELLHYRLVQDSGGPGRYRGGMGLERGLPPPRRRGGGRAAFRSAPP